MTSKTRTHQIFLRVFQFLFAFALLYKVSNAIVPLGHSDPLYYTLFVPKQIHYYGWETTLHDNAATLMTGVLELFTLLSFQFTENLGLIHILAQLLALGTSLVLGAFFLRRWTIEPVVGYLAAFSLLTFARDAAQFVYAKGDGTVATCAMIAAYCIYRAPKPWVTGFFIGLIPAVKISGLYPAAALGLITVLKYRKNPRYFLVAGATAIAVFAPFLVRNYLAIGNPLFPGFLRQIPGKAPLALIEYYSIYYDVPPNWGFVKAALSDLLHGKLIFSLWIYFTWRKWKTKEWERVSILAAGLLTLAIYCLTNGVYQGTRYFFAAFFIIGLFTFLELDQIFRSKKSHFLKTGWGLAFLAALALADARLEAAPRVIYANWKEVLTRPMEEIVDRAIAREANLWSVFPKHPDGHKRILTETTSEGYYLDPLYRVETREVSMDGGFLKYCDGPEEVAQLDNYDYFIFHIRGERNACYDKVRREGRLLGRFPEHHSEVYAKTWTLTRNTNSENRTTHQNSPSD